jgi:hypothetical protein
VLSLFVALVPGSESGSLGRWNSDHYSHYSAVVLFWHRGLAIYDTPIRELCDAPSQATRAFAKAHQLAEDDMCELSERTGERPLTINWPTYPRPYPPGQLLFHAPEALLYARTDVSRYAINRLTIIKDILAGHLAVWLLLTALLFGPDDDDRRFWRSLAPLVVPLVYFGLVPASVVGFYDPLSIAFVCIAIARMRDDRPVGAILWLSLAVFLHLRAVWYAPLGVACLLRLRSPDHRGELETWRGKLALAAGLGALGLTTIMLTRVAPYLSRFPGTNHAMLFRAPLGPGSIDLIFLLAVVASFLVRERQWLLIATIVWQAFVVGTTYQVQTWHGMFFLPLLALARWKRTGPLATGAILVFVVGVARLVFNAAPMPGMFLSHLLHGNL